MQPVGPGPVGQHTADRVGQRGDVLEPERDRLQSHRVERQAIDQRSADPGPLGFGDILGIGGEDFVCLGAHRVSRFPKRPAFGLGRDKR